MNRLNHFISTINTGNWMDFNKNIDFMMEKSPNITKKVTERSISHPDYGVLLCFYWQVQILSSY